MGGPFDIPDQREPCGCGSSLGYITERGAQDVVRCADCDTYLYCAPRSETGKPTRSVTRRGSIKPGVRWRVLERFNHTCVGCGANDVPLHVDHLIPLVLLERYSFLERDLLESEMNLAALCDTCNLGKSDSPASVRMMFRCLQLQELR